MYLDAACELSKNILCLSTDCPQQRILILFRFHVKFGSLPSRIVKGQFARIDLLHSLQLHPLFLLRKGLVNVLLVHHRSPSVLGAKRQSYMLDNYFIPADAPLSVGIVLLGALVSRKDCGASLRTMWTLSLSIGPSGIKLLNRSPWITCFYEL